MIKSSSNIDGLPFTVDVQLDLKKPLMKTASSEAVNISWKILSIDDVKSNMNWIIMTERVM
jgi:hypothetical protein